MVSPELIVGFQPRSVIAYYAMRLKIQDFSNGTIYSADIARAVYSVCGLQTHIRTEDTGWVEPSVFCPLRLRTVQYEQDDQPLLFPGFPFPGIIPGHPFHEGLKVRLSSAERSALLAALLIHSIRFLLSEDNRQFCISACPGCRSLNFEAGSVYS